MNELIDMQMDMTFGVSDGRLIEFGYHVLPVVVHWRVGISIEIQCSHILKCRAYIMACIL
jgi:hypothetical protein